MSTTGIAIAPCAHHWKCETPNGSQNRSVCRKCGEIRTFLNSEPPDKKKQIRIFGAELFKQERNEVGLYLSEKRKTEK